eukprot:GHUV01033367.1.p1 GENE.GHUV01033367.1~~GHUV01033367.1.p1  ORF type:complete len:133 (-),score=25.13 GHUV01033367.1:378-776(-)
MHATAWHHHISAHSTLHPLMTLHYVSPVSHNNQVTSSAVRLVSASSNSLLQQWSPSTAKHNPTTGGSSITLAAASPCQVLVAGGGGRLWLLEVTETGELVEVGGTVMDAEVACLDITPVGESGKKKSHLSSN